jgi:phosphoribosyl 1,2-cyclic phosphate phosphodiesterase
MIGCSCSTCRSEDPRDRRTNASILIETDDTCILVDCGRDFRQQALRENLHRVDHLFLTHTHFDHIAGIDDLRVFSQRRGAPIPVYGMETHLSYLKRYIYHYMFDGRAVKGGAITRIELVPLRQAVEVEGLLIEPLLIYHGCMPIYGYRFGRCAYLSDVSSIPDETLARIEDLDVLIIDALRFRPSPTHFNIQEALGIVARTRPKRTLFTHMCHDVLHAEVDRGLKTPASGYFSTYKVDLAWDGLRLDI